MRGGATLRDPVRARKPGRSRDSSAARRGRGAEPRPVGTCVAMGSWLMMSCARRAGNRVLVFSFVRRCGGAVIALTAMTSAAQAAPAPAPAKHSTDLRSLLEIRDDYTEERTSAMTNSLVFRGDYAPEPWVGFRVDLPLVYADKRKMSPAVGFGDVYARATVRLVASDVSLLTGSDFFLDTAATKVLGSGKNVVGPFATIAWDLGPGVWVRVQLQHLASIGGDPKRGVVSASSVRPYALISLPEGYWMVLDQTLRVRSPGTTDLWLYRRSGGREGAVGGCLGVRRSRDPARQPLCAHLADDRRGAVVDAVGG